MCCIFCFCYCIFGFPVRGFQLAVSLFVYFGLLLCVFSFAVMFLFLLWHFWFCCGLFDLIMVGFFCFIGADFCFIVVDFCFIGVFFGFIGVFFGFAVLFMLCVYGLLM